MIGLSTLVLSIEEYIKDIETLPLFFYEDVLDYRDDVAKISTLLSKINSGDYQMDLATRYKLPYDRFVDREGYMLTTEDTIVRYAVAQELKKHHKIKSYEVNPVEYRYALTVDIQRFYESVSHEDLIEHIFKNLNDCELKLLFETILKVKYVDRLTTKTIDGLCIGYKPDEFFAEIYLNIITDEIVGQKIYDFRRTNDEVTIFGNSIEGIKNDLIRIESVMSSHQLTFNYAKNKVIYLKEEFLDTKLNRYDEKINIGSVSMPDEITKSGYNVKNYKRSYTREPKGIDDDLTIDTYEDAIEFLSLLRISVVDAKEYAIKYRGYNMMKDGWSSSTPTEAKVLYSKINTELLFSASSIRKLERILYRYPKSQYWSAVTVSLLAFVATTIPEKFNNEDGSENDFSSSELANSILVNAVTSEDIHDYQRFLILRELMFDPVTWSISLDNYKTPDRKPYSELIKRELSDYYGGGRDNPFSYIRKYAM